jgi:hypothetical protein
MTFAVSVTDVPAGTAADESVSVVLVRLPEELSRLRGILRTGTGPGMGRRGNR